MLCCTKVRFSVVIYVYIELLRDRLSNSSKPNQVLATLPGHGSYMKTDRILHTSTQENIHLVNCSQYFCYVLHVLKSVISLEAYEFLTPTQFFYVVHAASSSTECISNTHCKATYEWICIEIRLYLASSTVLFSLPRLP